MMFYLATTVLLSQVIVLWYSLGFSWILVVIFGTVSGAVGGLLIYWLYTELRLLIQDMSKVDVAGKSVLITGCDSGFGLLLAESLVKRGMFVFAGVLNLNSTGANNLQSLDLVKVIKMDVTKDEDVGQAFDIVNEHLTKTNMTLRAVVNNAGILQSGMMEFMKIDKVRQLLEVNSLGVLRVSQRFSPLLRGHGRIVNITSVGGLLVFPFLGSYCASKFASEAISKALRIELYSLNVPVITIRPGGYKTSIINMDIKLYGDEEVKVYGKRFLTKCDKAYQDMLKSTSENTYEVINCLESAILNEKYQYSYTPNVITRLFMALMSCISDEYLVKTGCKGIFNSIPTTID